MISYHQMTLADHMISYHQMTLADVFTETQELFESDKPEFLKLLESSIDLSELISVTGSDPTVPLSKSI